MLAAVLGLAACGGVHAQTPRFYARERGAAVARDDAAVAVATWEDESTHTKWVYTAGWVTQNDASGNPHKRLAVFRYNEEDENLPPPIDPPGLGTGCGRTRHSSRPVRTGRPWASTRRRP